MSTQTDQWRRQAHERTARRRAVQVLSSRHAAELAELVRRERVLAALDWN